MWISNEQDFSFYDNSLLVLEVVYSLRNVRRSQYKRAGSCKFSFRSKDCLLYFHYGLWVIVFFLFIRVGILSNQCTSSGSQTFGLAFSFVDEI